MTTLSPSQDAAALAEALAHLCEDAHPYHDGWRARCPSHQGQSDTSLSLDPAEDRVLVQCFGSCDQQAVVHALGLTLADLFVTPREARTNGHKRIVKVYDYYDSQGTLVHQTVRYVPKDFKQRRPDPSNPEQYIWRTKDIERVLYNLPAVLAAMAHGGIIHLAEGEKDADTLIACGLVATTVPQGAKYWRDSYTATLTGVHVVVWPDNDKAGQTALAKVQRHLTGKAATLRVVTVPAPHKDVSDWVQAGATIAEVEALLQTATTPPALPGAPATPAPAPTASDPPDQDAALPYSDYTNARAFVQDHGPDLRYCYPWNAWLVWTGTHWQRDMSGEVLLRAKQTVKRLARQVEYLDETPAKALMAHIKTSLSTAKLKALVENAQSEKGIAVQPEDLDTDPWLLNVANGTLDLRTVTLRPHVRTDLLTFALPVAYDATAVCPTWDAFLHRIMAGNQTLIRFLQRAIGYALTGVIREHVLLILWGTGRNGKSTFLNLLRTLLAQYAMKAPSELLMVSNNDRHPTERADLWGKRFVSAIETEQGRRLAEVFVKEATGGDPIRARRMREDFWEFQPTHKVFLATNHKPVISGTDTAIWERIRLVPFTVMIPPHERDTTLPDKLAQELPGILTWALQGCLAWQQDGLGEPDEVKHATAGYRTEMDILGQFIDACCLVGHSYRVKASDLYDAYRQWSQDQGDHAEMQRSWGMKLTERGFESGKVQGRSWWKGIALVTRAAGDETKVDEERDNGLPTQQIDNKGLIGNNDQQVDEGRPENRVNELKNPHEGANAVSSSTSSTSSTTGGESTPQEACPQCRCTSLLKLGQYRKCPLCVWKGSAEEAAR